MFASTLHIWSVASGTPVFCGKYTALPESSTERVYSGTMSLVAGSLPTRYLYISTNVSAEVANWTCVWFGISTFVAPTTEQPTQWPLPAHSPSDGMPAGRRSLGELPLSRLMKRATFAARAGELST